MGDVRLALPDLPNEGDFVCSGEIPIFDMAGFSWRHATKVVISTLRVYMKYTQVCIKLVKAYQVASVIIYLC